MMEDVMLFEGLKVLDVGSWIAGPVATTMLADRGAEVLKIEAPVTGDGYRQYANLPFTPNAEVNYTWAMDARNKRSMALNLKSETGMGILHQMIKTCDIYVTNQPLPLRRQLKLNYEDIRALNERMIYASLTPYGEVGPDAENEAFDLVAYWNRSGLMDAMRHQGIEPVQALPGLGDHPTAVAMYASIVTALLKRERTGQGSMVHTSLLANGLWSASCLAQGALAGADMSPYDTPRLTGALYETLDGRWIQLSMIRTDEDFDRLLLGLDAIEVLADERFATAELRFENGAALTQIVREKFATKTCESWLAILKGEQGLPIEAVARFSDLHTDEHLRLNRMVTSPVDDIGIDKVINDPVNVEGIARIGVRKAPEMGEHTHSVLTELGYSATEIAALQTDGIIG